uniref:Protein-arginine deiminase n=1 Tax=Denticeps clupeoides TaxID=299321 RepID=A0AAY4DG28_9TELE
MIPPRTLRIETGTVTRALYVIGTELCVNPGRNAPPGAARFSVDSTHAVRCRVVPGIPDGHAPPGLYPLTAASVLFITMETISELANDSKLSVTFYGEKNKDLGKAVVHITAVEISLDVDADRDGVVEKNNPNKGSWQWGSDGHGAVLLVNCDSESKFRKKRDCESDYNAWFIRHPRRTLFSIFVKEFPVVLSSDVLSQEVPYLGGTSEVEFFVEGLRFPDKDFEGLVTINLSLLEPCSENFPETPIFTDKVVFRVAPWIMTPNTLKPVEVFVCCTSDNYPFLKGMRKLVEDSGPKLRVCSENMNRGDRWMQDELEFGYIDAPHQGFPVVLDSPRNGELGDFPYEELLGPDFGYVTREPWTEEVTSLDSFGNLEVSPPVVVNGKSYPLGRIIIGVAFPTVTQGRNMTKVVQDFLYAQKVQDPIRLYSDWLVVGHVDEFMTFVPAPDKKGFRLLLASPDAGYKLLRKVQEEGHGQAKLFEGLEDADEITVDDLLSNEKLQAENRYVQNCIDWNRDVLKRELGLDDEDIIDLPILFTILEDDRAAAYYPDMVNMIVLGKNLGVPKPFGPKVNGRCALEAEMCSLMAQLGLRCTFIDDFASYHKLLGEVHCGSNVRREPFKTKWWSLKL